MMNIMNRGGLPAAKSDAADWIARVAAMLLDLFLASLLYAIVVVMSFGLEHATPTTGLARQIVDDACTGVLLGACVLYTVGPMWFLKGTSIGNRMLGLQVVRLQDDGPVPFGRACVREVAWKHIAYLLAIPMIADVIMVTFTAERRSLGDRLLGTRVRHLPGSASSRRRRR